MPSAPAVEPPEPTLGETMAGVTAWIRENPLATLLLAVCGGLLVYFYGFYSVFMNGAQSTAVWAWKGWNEENDQVHCRFILPLILFLLWRRRGELMSIVKEPRLRGLAFVIGGILLFILGVRCLQARLAIVSLPLIVYGSAEYLGGKGFARVFIFPCLLMLFMVPIGGVIQSTVTLQLLASKTVGALCALLHLSNIQLMGTTISVDGHSFEVAGGCSGIRSLMAMTMLAALYVYFALHRPWQQFVVFAGSIFFALIGNIARLFTVVLVAKFWSPEIAGGLYHDYSGFVFFPIAVLAMVSFGNLLSRDWSQATERIAKTLTAPDVEAPRKEVEEVESEKKPTSPISYDY